jgi:hypothetical protein
MFAPSEIQMPFILFPQGCGTFCMLDRSPPAGRRVGKNEAENWSGAGIDWCSRKNALNSNISDKFAKINK